MFETKGTMPMEVYKKHPEPGNNRTLWGNIGDSVNKKILILFILVTGAPMVANSSDALATDPHKKIEIGQVLSQGTDNSNGSKTINFYDTIPVKLKEEKQVDNQESRETLKVPEERLLNKENMNKQDKKGMQASIDYLKDNDMWTNENIAMLEKVSYHKEGSKEYILIGGVKRTKWDLQGEDNNRTIFQRNNNTFFRSREIRKQGRKLAKEGKKIPRNYEFGKSLIALPGGNSPASGDLRGWDYYSGGNILSLLTGMDKSGYHPYPPILWGCLGGEILDDGDYGYRWHGDPSRPHGNRWHFKFGQDKAGNYLNPNNPQHSYPIRPVFE